MRVVVQIGHYKCGTSALQRRFADSRDLLRRQGIIYPDLGPLFGSDGRPVPSHSALPFEMLIARGAHGPPWYRHAKQLTPGPPSLDSVVDRLRKAIAAAGDDDTVFISSEEFVRFGESKRTEGMVDDFAEMIAGHPTTIFCYLRRHDLYLASWYNQLVKMGGPARNLSGNIKGFLNGVHVDYARALRPWVDRFGRDNVVVRRYEDRQRDVSEDVLCHVGLDASFPADTEVWENPRFPDAFVETLRRWNHLPMPHRVTVELRKLMRAAAADPEIDRVRVDVLAPQARRLLHARAILVDAELSELLALDRSLFPDLNEILEPVPDSITDTQAHNRWGADILEQLVASLEAPSPQARLRPLSGRRRGAS